MSNRTGTSRYLALWAGLLMVTIVILLTLLVSCQKLMDYAITPAKPEEMDYAISPAKPEEMKYAEVILPRTFNPLTTEDSVSRRMLGMIYTGLVEYRTATDVVPVLVKRVRKPVIGTEVKERKKLTIESCGCVRTTEMKDGRTVYAFELRDDIEWHDGTPLTAMDVLSTYNWAKRNDTVYDFLIRYLEDVRVDGNNISFTIRKGIDPLELFMIPILPDGHVSETPVGCGFFQFGHADESSIKLERYDKHPLLPDDIANPIKAVTVIRIPDRGTMFQALKMKQIDFVPSISSVHVAVAYGIPHISVFSYTTNNLMSIAINMKRLSDIRVREALLYALDRKQIMALYLPSSMVIDGFVPPGYAIYVDFPIRGPDKKRARDLLKQSHFRGGLSLKVNRELLSDVVYFGFVNALITSWEAVGFNVSLITPNFKGFLSDVAERKDFDLALVRYEFGRGYSFRNLFGSNGKGNITGYQNKEVDRLFNDIFSTSRPEEIKRKYEKIQQAIYNDIPYIPLGQLYFRGAYNNRIDTKKLIQSDNLFGLIHLWEISPYSP